MFEPGMNLVVSPTSGLVYFKNMSGKLCSAPIDPVTNAIDFRNVTVVNYFALTPEEVEDAFNALSVLAGDEKDYEVR